MQKQQTGDMKPAAQYCLMGYPAQAKLAFSNRSTVKTNPDNCSC